MKLKSFEGIEVEKFGSGVEKLKELKVLIFITIFITFMKQYDIRRNY